jgi:hypothetical protein
MELGGQNICPTTFAPHVWHLRGKLGVNLPHLPHLPHHPNRPQNLYQKPDDGGAWTLEDLNHYADCDKDNEGKQQHDAEPKLRKHRFLTLLFIRSKRSCS